ncbi:HD domain-containing protein 2 [Histomonas meleagridis]|uniref:HD domain-containing protein 2 n=1 Tax=Histomonas meleagridis TaxID=135588 RepID=UPI003559ADB1|nr:HD domain-containing protein 2 [Histomonas meleagridis]KAH0800401.1 HD domain-containing protein 2 [Histomonas meleagridis]
MQSTKYDHAIELCGILKRIPRTGWVKNHVNDPESVADHSMRTAFLAMTLCPPEVNREKAVQMALIHDLAESIVSDITPFDGVTESDKFNRENSAFTNITESLEDDYMQKLWLEMEEGKTIEAKFVKQLDKLEMLIQAEEYEKLQPGLDLSQFFKGYPGFEGFETFFTFQSIKDVYQAILERRKKNTQ